MEIMVVYFKYKLRKVVSYQKILQESNIKFLNSCQIEGYNHILTNSGYVYFSVENQLYRLFKLSYLDNKEMKNDMSSLSAILKKSDRIEESDIPENYTYWFKGDTFEYFGDEIYFKQSEYKERVRNHDRYYNQKYKLKKY